MPKKKQEYGNDSITSLKGAGQSKKASCCNIQVQTVLKAVNILFLKYYQIQ